jgi:hypothetical protein
MKTILGILLLLVIGGAMVFGGLDQTGSDTVTCGGEVMAPGDICRETSGGSSTDRGYDEQLQSQRSSGWVLVSIGGVVLAGGLAMGVAALTRRGRAVPVR